MVLYKIIVNNFIFFILSDQIFCYLCGCVLIYCKNIFSYLESL